ncbi:hypothetical protein MMC07_007478, partial [Pseudocyphellaria aurata]|nr:hypothetical protein [Pseudocyphellaria aurata]
FTDFLDALTGHCKEKKLVKKELVKLLSGARKQTAVAWTANHDCRRKETHAPAAPVVDLIAPMVAPVRPVIMPPTTRMVTRASSAVQGPAGSETFRRELADQELDLSPKRIAPLSVHHSGSEQRYLLQLGFPRGWGLLAPVRLSEWRCHGFAKNLADIETLFS